MTTDPTTLHARWAALQAERPRLADWRLVVNGRMTSAAGRCHHHRREVHIAGWHLERSPRDEVLDTLLHEAAHALAGARAGHGAKWQALARELGANPSRALPREVWKASPSAQRPPRWSAECVVCGQRYRRKRRPRKRRLVCGVCRGRLVWSELAH